MDVLCKYVWYQKSIVYFFLTAKTREENKTKESFIKKFLRMFHGSRGAVFSKSAPLANGSRCFGGIVILKRSSFPPQPRHPKSLSSYCRGYKTPQRELERDCPGIHAPIALKVLIIIDIKVSIHIFRNVPPACMCILERNG